MDILVSDQVLTILQDYFGMDILQQCIKRVNDILYVRSEPLDFLADVLRRLVNYLLVRVWWQMIWLQEQLQYPCYIIQKIITRQLGAPDRG